MEFVEKNYKEYKSILEGLTVKATIPQDFFDNLVLQIIPELPKAKSPDEIDRIVRVELLNVFTPNELPHAFEVMNVSRKVFEYYQEVNRDKRSEKLNVVHKIVGLILILSNAVTFFTFSIYGNDGFSFGTAALIVGIIVWWLPSVSGILAIKKPGRSFFGTSHFIWLAINVGLIYFLLKTFSEFL